MRLSALLATLALAAATAGVTLGTVRAADRAPAADAPRAAPRPAQDAATPNVPYDGRFTFARIRFTPRGGGSDFFGRADLKWDHDYPRAERNFARILIELSTIRPYAEGGNVLALDDPELFKYPVAYLCEPGFWNPTEAEAAGMRAYLAKGGFMIFDDFFGRHWENFEAQLRRVLPDARLVRLADDHPIFDSFFHIEAPERGGGRRGAPEFWGVFEDNDPSGRLMVIVNFNNDIGEGWEWSDTGMMPVDVTSTDFKLGLNYIIYGMTH